MAENPKYPAKCETYSPLARMRYKEGYDDGLKDGHCYPDCKERIAARHQAKNHTCKRCKPLERPGDTGRFA